MAEALEGLTDEEQQALEQLPDDHPIVKALKASRSDLRKERAGRHIAELKATYPDLGLTPEDFEGLTPDKFEARAARLAALRGTAPAPAPPSTETENEPAKPEDTPQRSAFERIQQPVEGTPPNAGGPTISVDEAFALQKSDPAEFARLKAAGRIKNWPKLTDQGGRVTFSR